MIEGQQRIAIAEACGWTKIGWYEDNAGPGFCHGIPPVKLNADWEVLDQDSKQLPDYVNDLNMMNDAEKVLQDRCLYWPDYIDELSKFFRTGFPEQDATNWSQMAHASATQRAEAFLRTIGKWTDET